jgi:hypothetical protein
LILLRSCFIELGIELVIELVTKLVIELVTKAVYDGASPKLSPLMPMHSFGKKKKKIFLMGVL